MKLCESMDVERLKTISVAFPRPNNPPVESFSAGKTPVARSFRGTFPNSGGFLSDFHPTPAKQIEDTRFPRRLLNVAQSGQSRPLAKFTASTARPTGFGYAHRPPRYPIRRRESRIITRGTQPGMSRTRTLSAQPSQ